MKSVVSRTTYFQRSSCTTDVLCCAASVDRAAERVCNEWWRLVLDRSGEESSSHWSSSEQCDASKSKNDNWAYQELGAGRSSHQTILESFEETGGRSCRVLT